ncbi:MAG: TonB-dependent receptor [Ignavibacteria bacterium]|nr:TonB-dependent receptor [Ignavibacteria bacterium]
MRKYILFSLLIFIPILKSYSQNISDIKGKVIDIETGEPISSVSVLLYNNKENFQSSTDVDGIFYIKKVPEGSYILKVSRIGYKSKEIEVKVFRYTEQNIIIKLATNPIETEEINVTSYLYTKSIRSIPSPIEIVDKEQILKTTSKTLSEIISTKSGIFLTRDGIWGTDVNIRGLSKNNIVTIIDGNRIETATDLSARLSMLDVSDIERVEIIKGGASTLYGTGATGGVVNIYTKTPGYNKKILGGSFQIGYNTVNNNPSTRLSIQTSSNRYYLKLSGTYSNAGNTRTPSGILANSQYTDYYLTAVLGLIPYSNNELKIQYQNYYAKDVGIPGGSSLFPQNAIVKYPQERRQLYSAEYKINNVTRILSSISLKYYYHYILRDVENSLNQVTIKPPSGTTPKQRITVTTITPSGRHYINGIQLQGLLKPFDNNILITGIDIWKRTLDSRRERNQKIEVLSSVGDTVLSTTLKTIGERPVPESDYLSAGTYLQDEIILLKEKLKLTIGGRIDKINISNKSLLQPLYEIVNGNYNPTPTGQKLIWNDKNISTTSWSGNVNIIYSIYKDLDLTLNIARSFRSPNLEERYQYIDLGNIVKLGNPELESERGWFFDLGIRIWRGFLKSKNQSITFTGNVFLNLFNNLVSEVPTTYEGRQAYIKTNIGTARLYGFDFNFNFNFYKYLNFYLIAAYVRGEDTGNNTNLPAIPPFNTKVGFQGWITDWLNFDLNSVIFSKQDLIAQGEITTPGYAIFNLSLNTSNFDLQYFKLRIFSGIENIFNKEYRNHLSTFRGIIKSEPGFNFYAKTCIEW